MFAGTNSPLGFIDFFDDIMPLETARRRYFLKGSSGSGKSTLMKAVAAALAAAGCDAEHFRCANDADSLDAVAVADKGLCIMDATAPHARDPEICGAVDVPVDLAAFLDAQRVVRHSDELVVLTRHKTALYRRAAGCLAQLGGGMAQPAQTRHALDRRLFLSAVTPDGLVDFSQDCFADATTRQLTNQAEMRIFQHKMHTEGLATESFHNPLNPAEIQHLHVPALKTVFYVDVPDLPPHLKTQLDDAILQFAAARRIHHKIEEIFADAMDFGGVDELTAQLISDLGLME